MSIVSILMERDGLTKSEAKEVVRDVKEMMKDCNYDPVEYEEIMYSELGLEMDYIFELI